MQTKTLKLLTKQGSSRYMHPAAAAAHLLATNTQPTVTALRASHEYTRPPKQTEFPAIQATPQALSSIRPTLASVGWGTGGSTSFFSVPSEHNKNPADAAQP